MESLKIPKAGEGETIHRAPVKSNRFVDADTILFFFGQLKTKAAAKKLAAKAEAAVRKQFQNTGITLNVFDTVVRLSEQEDADAVQKYMDEFFHVAQAFAVPVGTQMAMFDGPASVLSAKEKARKQGRVRGVAGDGPDTQAYPENTDLGQEHMDGWHEGQEVLQTKFKAHNEVVRAAEAAKKAKDDERAKKKAEKAADVPKTGDGETVN